MLAILHVRLTDKRKEIKLKKKKGVSKYASVAAFEDTRFNPIALSEVEVFCFLF
jgi:AMMECR1 domain-containing protein